MTQPQDLISFPCNLRAKSRAGAALSELQELSEQYEDIMEDCGHGKFQWTLFMVLGLALMADGVECFVVAFVLPSAEKDLCLSNAEKGMLGKADWLTDLILASRLCMLFDFVYIHYSPFQVCVILYIDT